MSRVNVITHVYNEIEVPFLIDNKTYKMVPCHEKVERNRCVTDFLQQCGNVDFTYVDQAGDIEEHLKQVHDPEYIEFLKKVSGQLGRDEYVLNHKFVPSYVENDTPIVRNTYKQACMSAAVALTAAEKIAKGQDYAYALCRPPGHHAGKGFMGGYCYFNNAVLAVEMLLQKGFKSVGIFDTDYHFGNGTYDLVQNNHHILFASLHASTRNEYPYYSFEQRENCFLHEFEGAPKEKEYLMAFEYMLERLIACEAIVVSLGYDIIQGDPHGNWNFRSSIYKSIGERFRKCGVPVCFVQEGGYSTDNMLNCVKYLVNGLSGQEDV